MKNQKETRDRLQVLGVDRLADELLRMAKLDSAVAAAVNRLTMPREELSHNIGQRIASLKRRRRFHDWRETDDLAQEMLQLLGDIGSLEQDPAGALPLLEKFFQTDNPTFERVDDSSGIISSVYQYYAAELFCRIARACPDRALPPKILLRLLRDDRWDIRLALVDKAAQYLDREEMAALLESFRQRAVYQNEGHGVSSDVHAIESLARQLGDVEVLEFTKRRARGKLYPHDMLELAQVQFANGDAQAALDWLDSIPADTRNLMGRDDELRLKVLGALGRTGEQSELALRLFRESLDDAALADLLAIVGEERRAGIISAEVERVMAGAQWSLPGALFLQRSGALNEAQDYLLRWRGAVDGNHYMELRDLATAMEAAGYPLAAGICYRALLESILQRAYRKAYYYAVRYLLQLDALASQITDWQGIEDHTQYMAALKAQHGRKHSFWKQYAERGGGSQK